MTIQALRCFVAVADTQSFTAAAARVGMTQPSLSEQIKNLERSLKTPLFDRLHRKVILTASGRALLSHARQIIVQVDSLGGIVQESGDDMRGPLAIAATPTLAPFIIATAIAQFTKSHPHVDVSVLETPALQIVEQIKIGECDLGIVGIGIENAQILIEPLFSESLVVALPRRHKLAARAALGLGDLAGETLILIDELREIASPLLSASVKKKERAPSIFGKGLQLATIETLVAAGAGICLLPAMARNTHSQKGIAYRPINGRAPVRTVSAIWHRDRVRPLAARRFMETLRDVISKTL